MSYAGLRGSVDREGASRCLSRAALTRADAPADFLAAGASCPLAAGSTSSPAVDVPAWVQDAALLDAIAAAVVATDTAGTIFYFNRAAEQLCTATRESRCWGRTSWRSSWSQSTNCRPRRSCPACWRVTAGAATSGSAAQGALPPWFA